MNRDAETPLADSESGFTMIELLVAMAMMIVITGAAVAMLVSAMQNQPKITSKADQIGDARVALERIVNEIRQGSAITTQTAEKLTLSTYIRAATCTSAPTAGAAAILCPVTYECAQEASKTTFACTRQVSTATATSFVSKLNSKEVFTYVPTVSPTYVGVKISLPATSGSSSTVLEGGAALRNSTTILAN
jgi:type II secretory pathway pseudopilin PulG